jgi:hypothetical protein
MSAPRQPSLARRRISALLRLLTVPLIIVGVHSVTRFSPWLLVPLGIVAAALNAGTDFAVPGFRFLSRLNRVDRLAIWIVLVCLIVIGYLHNANTWTADERGFGKPADIAMCYKQRFRVYRPINHALAAAMRAGKEKKTMRCLGKQTIKFLSLCCILQKKLRAMTGGFSARESDRKPKEGNLK